MNSSPVGPDKLLERRDGLISAVSGKGLICAPKLHELVAYTRRSEKVDSIMYCQYSVLILDDLPMKR